MRKDRPPVPANPELEQHLIALLERRAQLAHRLQDDVLQRLFGVGLLLERSGLVLQRTGTPQAARTVTDAVEGLNAGISRIRSQMA